MTTFSFSTDDAELALKIMLAIKNPGGAIPSTNGGEKRAMPPAPPPRMVAPSAPVIPDAPAPAPKSDPRSRIPAPNAPLPPSAIQTPPPPPPSSAQVSNPSEVTKQMLESELQKLATSGKAAQAIIINKQVGGFASINDIPAEKYADVIAAYTALDKQK